MKKILFVMSLIFVLLLAGCNKNEKIEENNVQENQNNQQQENTILQNNALKIDSKIAKAFMDVVNSKEAEKDVINSKEAEIFDHDFRYELIFFDDDDVPELLIDRKWYALEIYKYEKNNLTNEGYAKEIGGLGYGTHGRGGYDYAPMNSIVTGISHDTEKYGYTEYYELNNSGELETTYIIKTVIFSDDESELGKQTEEGTLRYSNLDELDFEPLSADKDSTEILAELENKTPEKMKEEQEFAISLANELYQKATGFYSQGGLKYNDYDGIAGEDTGYEITNIEEVKELFTTAKFDKYVGREKDESDNINAIREIDNVFYRLDDERSGDQYYIKTILMPNTIEADKIIFNAVSYYISDFGQEKMTSEMWRLKDTNSDEFLKSLSSINIDIKSNYFTIIKENDTWKVDEFTLPF